MTTHSLEDRSTTVSPKEAAKRLGIEPSTLANWRWKGEGPHYLKLGGRVRYRIMDIADYLDGEIAMSGDRQYDKRVNLP